MVFSPDGKTLASAGGDGTIILWDLATGKPLGPPLTGHKNWISSLAFSPDGKTLASAGGDATIILWDMVSRQPLGPPLRGHKGPVLSLVFSPDGKTLASGSDDMQCCAVGYANQTATPDAAGTLFRDPQPGL